MTLDELTPLLEAWYDTAPGGLGLPANSLAHVRNPTLRKFYTRLGRLTEIDAPYWMFGGQDEFLPPSRLEAEDGMTIFGVENQGCFALAAADEPNTNVFAQGDSFDDRRLDELADLGIPLEECVVSFVLRETIFTTSPMFRDITPRMIATAKTGHHHRGRYINPDDYGDFWLADDICLMQIPEIDEALAAPKGAWRQPLQP